MFLQKVLLFAGDKRLDSVSWNGFYFSIFNMVSCSFLWKWQPEFSCSYRNTGIYPIFLYSMSLGIFSLLFTELYLFFFPMTMWNAYSFKQCYEILRTDNSNLIAFTHLPSSKNARENSMQSPFSENYTIYFLLKYYFFRRYFRIVWISCLQGNLRHSECKDS